MFVMGFIFLFQVFFQPPASASHSYSTGTSQLATSGGTAAVSAVRGGWGALITARVSDTVADGDCMYVEAKLDVADGTDPDKTIATVCGRGNSKTVTYGLAAGKGTGITHIEFKVCRSANTVDPCDKTRKPIPVHLSHLSNSGIQEMDDLMNGSLSSFMAAKADAAGPYDWTDDGCSAPSLGGLNDTWKRRFKKPCLRHDFGYRNYGKRYYDAHDARRMFVDNRFLLDMRGICDANDWRGCGTMASNFWTAVRQFGGAPFYGEPVRGLREEQIEGADVTGPTLAKPIATLSSPSSRVVNFSLTANDDMGVTQLRVKVSGEEWRPWVDFVSSGTVVLPDRYGTFTIWFQVRDAAGNESFQRAADNVTRVQDTTDPTLGKPVVTHSDPASRTVSFSLDAADDTGVTQMRVRVGPDEASFRPWVDFVPNGTVILPDRYGTFTIWFQVSDAAGNVSFERAADNVTRTAPVSLTLQQIDNNGNVRSCGSSDAAPCSDIVRKFRTTISCPVLPDVDLLVKAWRLVDGSWVETNPSPHMRMTITGNVMEFEFTPNALPGIWRFQTQVPRDPEGVTDFGASNYQYLRVD